METRTIEEVKEVMKYTSENKSMVSRVMLDNMVVPLEKGDVDVSMLRSAVDLIGGKLETEVTDVKMIGGYDSTRCCL